MSKIDKPATSDDIPTLVLIPAFIVSELRIAFQIGFLLYLPFIMIDMVVSSVLLSMGMLMLPPIIISLPFKVLLFVMIDGWYLLVLASQGLSIKLGLLNALAQLIRRSQFTGYMRSHLKKQNFTSR